MSTMWTRAARRPWSTAGWFLFAVAVLVISEHGVVRVIALAAFLGLTIPLALLAKWSLRRKPRPSRF